ncbi:flagellar export protein FliJ [Aneurinibacillus terranovensis]|uniref:flagellar export protein FliJ n=1 Tax=Aneurinibacillus terranovensis TaxID=278991 RepID=UPI0003F82E18|nr:flagellar export protein FliJ [Aneurinibacillus terranovensis]
MSFNYTFQKILDVKKKEKGQAEKNYTKSLHTLRLEESKLYQLQQNKEEMEQRFVQQAEKNMSLAELKHSYLYLDHMHKLIVDAEQSKTAAESDVHQKQEVLTEKAMDEKIWAKLKENSYVKHLETMKQLEQKQLDEIAVTRYYRRTVKAR